MVGLQAEHDWGGGPPQTRCRSAQAGFRCTLPRVRNETVSRLGSAHPLPMTSRPQHVPTETVRGLGANLGAFRRAAPWIVFLGLASLLTA